MIMYKIFVVFASFCVLVSWSYALEANGVRPCETSVRFQDLVINCSQRGIDKITTWPEEINSIDKDTHVLVTFFNNSITNLTELPPIGSSRVAFIFKFNKLTEIEGNAFKNIDNTVYLDLSNNKLTGQVLRSEIFQGSYKDGVHSNIALETLNLGFNEIHSLDIDLFQYTPNLTRLYLNNNPIEILDVVTKLALQSATNLEVLDLSSTGIDSIPIDAFRGLLNLREIDLSGNRFETVPESLMYVGTTLEFLTFNNNSIVELNDDSFNGLVNLKQLEVAENLFLEEVKRSTFSPLKNLKVLHLCHNPNLMYISHNAFRGLKDKWTLKEVYLDDNKLSELSVDLMPWSKLVNIGMSGNNWLCNCELVNIVNKQGAGTKFINDKIPYCAAPYSNRGEYITNITRSYCPTFDHSFEKKKGFSVSLRPKHVLWSILGVALVVCIGMLIGLIVNVVKEFWKKNIRNQPIRYINLNVDSSFA